MPQPTHYPTKPCETRPWTSAGGSRNLGLGKYEAAFRHNAIDEQVLRDLTAENLKEIGATVGDRRKLQLDRGVGRPVALGGASFAAQSAERPKTPEASAERRPLTS